MDLPFSDSVYTDHPGILEVRHSKYVILYKYITAVHAGQNLHYRMQQVHVYSYSAPLYRNKIKNHYAFNIKAFMK